MSKYLTAAGCASVVGFLIYKFVDIKKYTDPPVPIKQEAKIEEKEDYGDHPVFSRAGVECGDSKNNVSPSGPSDSLNRVSPSGPSDSLNRVSPTNPD